MYVIPSFASSSLEHLKELVFTLLRRFLEVRKSWCPLWYTADRWRGGEAVPPMILMAFPLDVPSLMVRFLGAIVDLVEAFKEDFLRFLERGLDCKNLFLNESTNLL